MKTYSPSISMHLGSRMRKILRVSLSILASAFFLFSAFTGNVYATNVTQSNTSLALGNSNPGTSTTYTLGWTPSDTTDSVKFILIQFATTAAGTTIPTGFTMGATPSIVLTGFGAATGTGAYNSGTGVLTVTLSAGTAASGSGVTVAISAVTNPNAGVFYAQITSETVTPTLTDYGVAATESVANITVTGTMTPSLTFTVAGVASGTTTGTTGAMNTTSVTSTSTTIPFGVWTALTTDAASQLITTTTNASFGYTVTLQENQALTYNASTVSDVGASTTWSNGSTIGFGVNTTNGTNGDTYSTNFSGNTKYQPISHSPSVLTLASASGTTNASGDSEYINYQTEVSAAQAAGTYTNTLDYVVVPVY